MDTFKTQFVMSGVPTDVTLQTSDDHTFIGTLNLADFFDGGEFEGTEQGPDLTMQRTDDGWDLHDGAKITLTPEDIKSLGDAIERDYLNKNTGTPHQ